MKRHLQSLHHRARTHPSYTSHHLVENMMPLVGEKMEYLKKLATEPVCRRAVNCLELNFKNKGDLSRWSGVAITIYTLHELIPWPQRSGVQRV